MFQSLVIKKDDGGSSSTDRGSDHSIVPNKRSKNEIETDATADEERLDFHIEHCNQPILMEVYVDPTTENTKLVVVAALPGGATDGDFNLLGAGPGSNIARITYQWPEVCYDVEKLFAKSIDDGTLPSCHPKILALKKGLQRARESVGVAPVGVINLNLPIPVLTSESTIIRKGEIDRDTGTLLLIIELTAYESAYTVQRNPIVFEEI